MESWWEVVFVVIEKCVRCVWQLWYSMNTSWYKCKYKNTIRVWYYTNLRARYSRDIDHFEVSFTTYLRQIRTSWHFELRLYPNFQKLLPHLSKTIHFDVLDFWLTTRRYEVSCWIHEGLCHGRWNHVRCSIVAEDNTFLLAPAFVGPLYTLAVFFWTLVRRSAWSGSVCSIETRIKQECSQLQC